MRYAERLLLGLVLHAFHQHGRIRRGDEFHALLHGRLHVGADAGAVNKELRSCRDGLDVLPDRFVRLQGNARRPDVSKDLLRDLLLRDVPDSLVLRQFHEGKNHGVAGNVPAAHVQEPADIGKTRDEVHVRAVLLHFRAYAGKLRRRGFARDLLRHQEGFMEFLRRAVRPEFADQIAVGLHADLLLRKRLLPRFRLAQRHDAAVKAEDTAVRQFLLQEILQGLRVLETDLVQIDAGALKFPLCLQMIAAVSPEACLVRRHCGDAGLSGKAGQESQGVEVCAVVFRAVEISAGHDPDIDPRFLHLHPKRVNQFFFRHVIFLCSLCCRKSP